MEFKEIFQKEKPVIEMIHLSGNSTEIRLERALGELAIYQENGVDGAIIEDYHGNEDDVYNALRESDKKGFKIIRGVNYLGDPYPSFELAKEFGAKFVQFDSVQTRDLHLNLYDKLRKEYLDIAVLGGVRFKYTRKTGNSLEQDLMEAKTRCEAIVTTGTGTGIETPLKKLIEFRKILGDFPLIAGAGVNKDNVYEQLKTADSAIIGSYFKPNGITILEVNACLVRNLIDEVEMLRRDLKSSNH